MANKNASLGGGGFHHVALRVRDFDKSVAFYTKVLGFVPRIEWGKIPERAIMLDTGDGNYFELFERPNQAPPPDGEGLLLHVAIRTNNCAAALQRARDAGCQVTMETKALTIPSRPEPTPVTIAFFKGPDGEILELFQNELT